MALYEHVFLARQDLTPHQFEQLIDQYKTVIETNGGKVSRLENWGLRSLAYRINKNRKSYYALMNIDAPFEALAEMERQMRFNEDILRFLTLRVDEHEEGPSAVLSRKDRDERAPKNEYNSRDSGRDENRPYRPRYQNNPASEGEE